MGKSEGNGEGWRRESKWEFTGEDDPGFGTETRGKISQFTHSVAALSGSGSSLGGQSGRRADGEERRGWSDRVSRRSD
jgi:hypothetical protein